MKRSGRLARPCKKHPLARQRFRMRARHCNRGLHQGYFMLEWYCASCVLEWSRRQNARKKLERRAKLNKPDDMWKSLPVDYFSRRV